MAEESDLIAVNEVLARIVEAAPLFDGAIKMLVDLANDYKNLGGTMCGVVFEYEPTSS